MLAFFGVAAAIPITPIPAKKKAKEKGAKKVQENAKKGVDKYEKVSYNVINNINQQKGKNVMENLLKCYAEIPPVAAMTGYEMKTTFWGDFRVCMLDKHAIQDTFNRAFNGWKDDQVYATELSLVLNWLSWYYAEKDVETSKLYVKLWEKIDGYVMDNWKGEKLSYYLSTTD